MNDYRPQKGRFSFRSCHLSPHHKRAAVSFADVTSANIVGYQNAPLKNQGYNFIIPTFEQVGTAKYYDLQDVKLVNAAGGGSEKIVLYSETAGLTGVEYTWYLDSVVYSGVDGWFNGFDYVTDHDPIPLGTGLYLNCPTAGVAVQYAGQVYDGALTNELPNIGYNMVGNCTPVEMDLQDLKLVGAAGAGSEKIVLYSETAGLTGVEYTWYLDSVVYSGVDGWFQEYDLVKGEKLAPGEGVYLNCPTANVKFVIPSALKK